MIGWRPVLSLLGWLLLAAAGGCQPTTTTYSPYQNNNQANPLFDRTVTFYVGGQFHRTPPDCTMVLPVLGAPEPLAHAVERSLAQHLAGRVPRVIDGFERRRAERRHAMNVGHPGDRRRLAEMLRCDVFMRAQVIEAGDDYVVFWSRRRLGLELLMTRVLDDVVIWKARHVANRSDGGVPFSLIGIAVAGLKATQLQADHDVPDSLIDDAIRRMMVTLPDVR